MTKMPKFALENARIVRSFRCPDCNSSLELKIKLERKRGWFEQANYFSCHGCGKPVAIQWSGE